VDQHQKYPTERYVAFYHLLVRLVFLIAVVTAKAVNIMHQGYMIFVARRLVQFQAPVAFVQVIVVVEIVIGGQQHRHRLTVAM
jgi:hypothetical protein